MFCEGETHPPMSTYIVDTFKIIRTCCDSLFLGVNCIFALLEHEISAFEGVGQY